MKETGALEYLVECRKLRGFFGGLVLRGEGHNTESSANIRIIYSETEGGGYSMDNDRRLLSRMTQTDAKGYDGKRFYGAQMLWTEWNFTQFGFDIIALINGSFKANQLSSELAFGASNWILES